MKLIYSLLVILTLGACSPTSILTGLLTGGGLNAATNVQAGKTNTQAVVSQRGPEVVLRPKSRVDSLDQSTTTNNELPPWIWISFIVLFIIGWTTDTPGTLIKNLRKR